MFRKHKSLSILAVCLLIFQLSILPSITLGDDKPNSTTGTSSSKPVISLEQAVEIVKNNFSIPAEYSRFSSGYNDYNNRAVYSLNWDAIEEPHGSFRAEVDAKTGEIVNMNRWDGSKQTSFAIPVLSAGEAEKVATELVAKLLGKYQAELKLVKDDEQVLSLNYYGPFTYQFRWIRVVNGIPFPGNGVNVGVRGDNGQVGSFNFNWTKDLSFPEASKIVPVETARQVFEDTPMLELQYFLPPVMNPESQEPQRVMLVYQISNKYFGGAINALTGKPLIIDSEKGYYRPYSSTSSAVNTTMELVQAASSEEKPINIEVPANGKVITRDEAIAAVKKYIEIPEKMVFSNASLNPDWENRKEQIWNLDWRSEPFDRGEFRFLNARVNASTGDLVGFNMPGSNSSEGKDSISREEAQKIAEEFLEKIQPERFKQVKLESGYPYGGKMPAAQSFNYVRQVNGIPVSRNSMNVTVDTVSKRVINYNQNWSNVEFPRPENIIKVKEATERFLKQRPLTLNYTVIYQQGEPKEAHLVYQPQVNVSSYTPPILDAKTGEPLDWNGRPESQWLKPHRFTDIQGNFAEKEIGIMGLVGAFGEYGNTFRPDEKVTVAAFLRAMLMADGMGRDRAFTDEEVMKTIKQRGWLKEDLNPGSELSRENLAKITIRLLNMETSAQVKGIFHVPFIDGHTIQPDSLGYIALAWGLGILKVDGWNLMPYQVINRAEAAYALVHAYAVRSQVR